MYEAYLGARHSIDVFKYLDRLAVRLVRGTAIIEATGAEGTEQSINITTPYANMTIVRSGLYRVSVIPGNATELFVRKGRVLLANSQTQVKGGNKVIFSANTFSVAKLNKADKKKDDFDDWSKLRAETVAVANRRIPARSFNSFVASLHDDWFFWGAHRTRGMWVFNPRAGCWTFLPFYFGWDSPYGSGYSSVFFPYFGCCGGSSG